MDHLLRRDVELAEHDVEEPAALADAIGAGDEDPVEGEAAQAGLRDEAPQMRLFEVGVGDGDQGLAAVCGRLQQCEHVQVGGEQVALELELDGHRLGRCARPGGQDAVAEVRVDLRERDLHAPRPVDQELARAVLGLAAQRREAVGGDVGRQEAGAGEPVADEAERPDGGGDLAPQQGVEDVGGDHLDVGPGDRLGEIDEAGVGDRGDGAGGRAGRGGHQLDALDVATASSSAHGCGPMDSKAKSCSRSTTPPVSRVPVTRNEIMPG